MPTILVMLTGVAQAQTELCDAEWWRDSATAASVSMMAQEQNPDGVCPNTVDGDYPMHLAVFFANNVEAVEALIEAGASMARTNVIGQTPATLVDIRLNAAVTLRLPTDVIIGIEQLINQETAAQNLAQNNLCSLTWWPSATRADVGNAINQGADLNQDCDGFGNRPIHIALNLNIFPYPLSDQSYFAIVGGLLEDGGVIPDARAVELAEARYTATKINYEELLRQLYEGNISGVEFDRDAIPGSETALYAFVRAYAEVESYENATARINAELVAIGDRVFEEYSQRLPNPPRQ